MDEWICHKLYEQRCGMNMGEKSGYGHRAVFLTPLLIYRDISHRSPSSNNVLLVISDANVAFPYLTGVRKCYTCIANYEKSTVQYLRRSPTGKNILLVISDLVRAFLVFLSNTRNATSKSPIKRRAQRNISPGSPTNDNILLAIGDVNPHCRYPTGYAQCTLTSPIARRMRNRHRLHRRSGSHQRRFILFLLDAVCYSIGESAQEEEDGTVMMIACLPCWVLGVGLRRKELGFERLRVFKVVMQKFDFSNFCIATLKTLL